LKKTKIQMKKTTPQMNTNKHELNGTGEDKGKEELNHECALMHPGRPKRGQLYTTTFYQIPVGARFRFWGAYYVKVAGAVAENQNDELSVFHHENLVSWYAGPGERPGEPMPKFPPACPSPVARMTDEQLAAVNPTYAARLKREAEAVAA